MRLGIILGVVVLLNLFYGGHLTDNKANRQNNVVYVSKNQGKSKSDNCGSESSPCKTLQDGVDKLTWGGQLLVDGEKTALNPYMCESSAGKLEVKTSISIQSYITTAHISCIQGFNLNSDDHNAAMDVTITGLQFNNTLLLFKDTSVVIRDCSFTASEPAIIGKISNEAPLDFYLLDIRNAVFTRNHGCIQFYVKEGGGCSSVIMKLRDSILQNNTMPRSGMESRTLIFVRNKNCCPQEMSLFFVWENVTMLNNQGSSSDNTKDVSGSHTKSVLDVDACRVNLQFTKVTSVNNENMRFLTSKSQDNFIQIKDSRYYGHLLDRLGGVLRIKGNKAAKTRAFVNVSISNSVFYNNSGTLGGVFQIDGGKEKNVNLRMKNVELFKTHRPADLGCDILVGDVERSHVPIRSVANISASFDSLQVTGEYHGPFSFTKKKIKHYPAVCLRASEIARITVENSLFYRTKSQALLIRHIPSGKSKGNILNVGISNTSFINNSFSAGIKPVVKVDVSLPEKMQQSTLNIYNSTFLGNRGVAIIAQKIEQVYIKNLTCNGTLNGVCLDIKPSESAKQSSPRINTTLALENCEFSRNAVPLKFICFKPWNLNISMKNIRFHNNRFSNKHGKRIEIRIGQSGIPSTLKTGNIFMDGVLFTSNDVQPAHGSVLGVFVIPSSGTFQVVIRNSEFKDNSVHKHDTNDTTFVNLFYFYIPHSKQFRNESFYGHKHKRTCPEYSYRNRIIFENVIFSNNTAISSILYVNSGTVSFHRCLFKDNFSFQSNIGSHLYVEKGATTVRFDHSTFIQTKKNPHAHAMNSNLSSLLFFGAQGPLIMRNTTFRYALFTSVTVPMFILESGRSLDMDKETTFVCPVGNYLKLYNATFKLNPEMNDEDCSMTIIRLRFWCRMCTNNKYTLESGSFNGTQKNKVYIPCFDCPFGARCTDNIQSQPNFWGYKTQDHPPKLLFQKCPDGYCKQPSSSNFSIYNKCAGHRNGTMCGACKENYTESVFNHKCRRIDDCQDHWFWVIAALYSVFMAIFVLCQPSLILFLIKKALWFREKKDTVPNSRLEQMRKTSNHDGHAYFKITFYFYQVAELLMLQSYSQILPNFPLLSTVTSFYNFHVDLADLSFGCPFPGLTAVTKELFLCSQVFAVMIVIVLFYLIHLLFSLIRKSPKPHFAHYLAGIIEVLLLGYERLGHTSLMLLNCTPLKMPRKVEWRLVLDGNITCWVHWWQFAMIAYNIVFVIPFLLVLFVGTSKLRRQKISASQFVAACFLPLPFLLYWLLKRCLRYGNDAVLEDSNPWDQERRNALLEVLQGPFRPPNNQSKGALYWESILIGRRLLLLCLFSFIAMLLPRLLCMTLVCMLILIHNVVVMPYNDRKANLFAVVLLSIHVAMATINLSESVLITAGVTFQGPLKSQIDSLKMLEIFLLSVLPCAFGLLVAAVVLSQTVRLLLTVSRYCLKKSQASSRRRLSYQPLLKPGEDIPSYLS